MPPETHLDSVLNEALGTFCFSGYQLVSECEGKLVSRFGGRESGWANGSPIGPGTRFDIASVTKAVATTSIAARLAQAGTIAVEDCVSKYLPLKGRWGETTLFQLLTHTSGLRGWMALYDHHLPGSGFLNWFHEHESEAAEAAPGEKVIYSDIGFLLLGEVLQRAGGADTAELFHREVVSPLGLTGVEYGPVKGNVAATEFCLWRNRLLQGEVFDANAAALEGRAAHAGLFSSASSLAPFAREWLKALRGESKWLTQPIAKRFTAPTVALHGTQRGLGWDLPSATGSSAGELLSRDSFGHLGYTGTSLWIDPHANGFILFLTNRVHPSRFDERIRTLRPLVHDGVAREWKKGLQS